MNHERQQSLAVTATDTDVAPDAAPGRASRTDRLNGPTGLRPTGLLMRKASRDGNNVAADADAAVGAASSSTGSALPDDLRAKFEGSLGTDLSSVRVHTGSASHEAASAVGAKAYTLGNDVHFGAGHYDPSSSDGQHLLAHEVAHTVQQRGGSPTRQNKLEVSTPGDHFEHEADHAASAMVAGQAASVGTASGVGRVVQRDAIKDNSYNRGTLTWGQGGTALQEDEMAEWGAKKASVITKYTGLMAKAAGLQGARSSAVIAKLNAQAKQRFTSEVTLRELEIKHFTSESDNAITDGRKAENHDRGETATASLEKFKSQRSSKLAQAEQSATTVAGSVLSYAAQVSNAMAGMFGRAVGVDTSMFKSANEMTSKMQAALDFADNVTTLTDPTALHNFQNNPSFETARTWGMDVAAKIAVFKGLAGSLPAGWGDVFVGMLTLPGAVISQFADVVQAHYAMVERMTADGHFDGMILPGHSGGTPPPPE